MCSGEDGGSTCENADPHGVDERNLPGRTCRPLSAPGTSFSGVTEIAEQLALSPDVEVRRSARRRRTVSAYREGDRTVVLLPARMTRAEQAKWVTVMLERLAAKDSRRPASDAALMERAGQLSTRYLGGRARPTSVRWVDNQSSRWGSCTPIDGSIRLSRRLVDMPEWVLDYVLLHELVHLLEPGHGPEFWRLLAGYPRLERARGYLEGAAHEAERPGRT